MTEHTAFALRLASEYLRPLMPPATLRLLDGYFKHANRLLKGSALGRWANRARIIARGPALMPPLVREDVQRAAYNALLNNRLLEINYRSRSQGRPQQVTLNPLGLVFRETVAYLVATAWDYPDVRHYALHRMSKPQLLNQPARTPTGFRLASHIHDELRFSYPLASEKIKLSVAVTPEVAAHLAERRLSGDQWITADAGGHAVVAATVADTADLRWWLLVSAARWKFSHPPRCARNLPRRPGRCRRCTRQRRRREFGGAGVPDSVCGYYRASAPPAGAR